MFGEEKGIDEPTIAEQTNWRSIEAGDMDTALEIAVAYRKAEMVTANRVSGGRTESDMGSILMAICKMGVDIPLEEIPVSEINLSEVPFKYRIQEFFRHRSKPEDRAFVVNDLVKNLKDLNKVPPIVVTKLPSGKYKTVDGQNRSARAKKLDPNAHIRGYVIPLELAYNVHVMDRAARDYINIIKERGGSLSDAPSQ